MSASLKKTVSLKQKIAEDALMAVRNDIMALQAELQNLLDKKTALAADLEVQEEITLFDQINFEAWPAYWKKITEEIRALENYIHSVNKQLAALTKRQHTLFSEKKSYEITFDTLDKKEKNFLRLRADKNLDELNIINYNFRK